MLGWLQDTSNLLGKSYDILFLTVYIRCTNLTFLQCPLDRSFPSSNVVFDFHHVLFILRRAVGIKHLWVRSRPKVLLTRVAGSWPRRLAEEANDKGRVWPRSRREVVIRQMPFLQTSSFLASAHEVLKDLLEQYTQCHLPLLL